MLTLKAPIQLHIAQGLTGNAEAFGQRIRGNYGLLGAHFAPKDLLFLLTAPPELPEDFGGMTTLVNQQNTVDVRSVTMDVVNNVVNRILLDGTAQFTYQDQVYITTVLNRLGITNVAQFMEQVRQLRLENESTVHMTRLYRQELERILQKQLAGEEAPKLPLAAPPREEAEERDTDPRVTLCMDILKRLDTRQLYQTIHAFQRNWSGGVQNFQNQELRLSEQLRFSNTIALAELKQQTFQQPHLHFLHHLNQYEAGLLMEMPRNEEQVLSQAAAAALVNAVDNTVVEVLNRTQLRQEQWVGIKHALWQMAENSLFRFESYHSQPMKTVSGDMTDTVWNNYVQELKEYQTLYRKVYPKAPQGIAGPLSPEREGDTVVLTHVTQGSVEQSIDSEIHLHPAAKTDLRYNEITRRTVEKPTGKEAPAQTVQAAGSQTVPPVAPLSLTYWSQLREGDQYLRHIAAAPPEDEESKALVHNQLQQLWAVQTRELPGRFTAQTLLHRELEWQKIQQLRERGVLPGEAPVLLSRETGKPTEISFQPALKTVLSQKEAARPGSLPSGQAQEQASKRLTQQLSRIEQHNRTVLRTDQIPAGEATLTAEQLNLTYRNQVWEGDQYVQQGSPAVPEREEGNMPGKEQVSLQKVQKLLSDKSSTEQTLLHREREWRETQQLREKSILSAESSEPLPWELGKTAETSPQLAQRAAPPPEPAMPPVSLTPRQAEEQAPEALAEELSRIDQHNRTVLQNVLQEIRQQEPKPLQQPDLRRTMQDALRALEEPESVLRDVYRPDSQPPTIHREFSPREEALLRQASPEERKLYEAVLTYQKDPAAAVAQGLLRPGNLGAFHAQLQQAVQQAPVLEHLERETQRQAQLLEGSAETAVLEQFRQAPKQHIKQEAAVTAPPPAVKFVHKQAVSDVTEELLEQLERQRTQSIVQTDVSENVTRRESHQVDVNQMERKVVAQTTEDITELVNRTLARQMRSISDQVYRQMEKRLQMEHSRRGRL